MFAQHWNLGIDYRPPWIRDGSYRTRVGKRAGRIQQLGYVLCPPKMDCQKGRILGRAKKRSREGESPL